MVKRRAAIYARFSSHNQRSESIEIQVDAGTRYIAENGLELVKIYADYAKTGRNTDRREYKQMMNDARLGLFDYVVIYKVPRIMRNRDEMALTRIMLRKAGVEILYAGEEIASGSAGVLQLGMLEVLAEWESAIDSERIIDGIQKNAQRCMANGRTLYGWDIVEGRYVINDREAAVLHKMKNMVFAGSIIAEVVRAVANVRTRQGKPINHDRAKKLLLRPQNGGTYSYAGHVVEGGMPALWPKAEQDMLISILGNPRPRRRVDHAAEWPLTGKLYCAECGNTLAGTSGTGKSGTVYAYYKCKKCKRTFRRDILEDAIVDMTICALERPDVRKRIADGMATYEATMEDAPLESERLRKEIKRIDAAFERIWQAIEDGIAPPGGKERIEDLKARKDALVTEYQIAKANENIEPGFSELMDWLDNVAEEMNPQEILTMFVRAVQIDKAEVRLYFAFDYYGDNFTPPKKDEHQLKRCSSNSPMVEPSITKANTVISLETCYLQINRNWFAVIGNLQNTR